MTAGIISCMLGLWALLVGLGKIQVSNNPAANALFMSQWQLWFRILGPVLLVAGIVMMARS